MSQASTTTKPQNVVILGSTGSIGTNTLDVISQLNGRFRAAGLSAHTSWQPLFEQAQSYQPQWVVLTNDASADDADRSQLPSGCELLRGQKGIETMVTAAETDIVVTAIVGAAGLEGTWAALEAGKRVAVANKETLVLAGSLVMEKAKQCGATILPVDSEHNAIYQGLQSGLHSEVERVVLTASGGPFRGRSREEIEAVTPEQALQHPTWQMGPKITIDSATMMNKALEVIEARWLFDLNPDQIEVIIHPESIVHSFVEFRDGSVLAQLSPPDMRLPIQYALTYPERVTGPTRRLKWQELRTLNFEQPDYDTFPALKLGFEVARRGGTCGAVLNAANEVAVSRFLDGDIGFPDIARVCRAVLHNHNYNPRPDLTELFAVDRWARQEVHHWIAKTNLAKIPS